MDNYIVSCDLWIESDGDSIRNSCDVLGSLIVSHGHLGLWPKSLAVSA